MHLIIIKVLDSTGKTPDGILGDVLYYCDLMDFFVQPDYCAIRDAIIPDKLEPLVSVNPIVPKGNTMGYGSFEGKHLKSVLN